jgi:hypothetical protein
VTGKIKPKKKKKKNFQQIKQKIGYGCMDEVNLHKTCKKESSN